MLDLLIWFIVFIMSIVIILVSADRFVDNVVTIGKIMGISQLYWVLQHQL
ncbi:MAG: hypothetical protein LBR15_04130 [Methanobrevibacter sp.]|jgi:Ca2+/Na+ antiporter|nr:hypothetical protein [Candidatus Methanovirga australis]